jgi:hypothetical protein
MYRKTIDKGHIQKMDIQIGGERKNKMELQVSEAHTQTGRQEARNRKTGELYKDEENKKY